jgi:aspartyl aminopeptidase
MLSCDVSAAYDPKFPEAYEKKNAAFLGRGVSLNKYTGSRGKYDTTTQTPNLWPGCWASSSARGLASRRRNWQGGSGRRRTIAHMCAQYGMEVLDAGLPVLSMHAPWEIVSKADLYETLRALRAFLTQA